MMSDEFLQCLYASILALTKQVTDCSGLLVALSGGGDSVALLHGLSKLSVSTILPIRAIHIDHQLQSQSKQWAEFCRYLCMSIQIPLVIEQTTIDLSSKQSIETAARHARYHLFSQQLKPGEALITAHHQEDQVETFLLQLFRGAGIDGLAGIPLLQSFSHGYLYRPILDVSQQMLHDYLQLSDLEWIEDPMNASLEPRRNFIRHQVLPLIGSRWQGINKTILRAIGHQQDAQSLLAEIANDDFKLIKTSQQNKICIQALLSLSIQRQKNVLRYWLKQLDIKMPNAIHLEELLVQINSDRMDNQLRVSWPGVVEFRRYRQYLFCCIDFKEYDLRDKVFTWSLDAELHLPHGVLSCHKLDGSKSKEILNKVDVKFRRGGETIYLDKRGTKSVKKLFQEKGIPPWERDVLPFIYIDDEVQAVGNYWQTARFRQYLCDHGLALKWNSNIN